jgi:hypothetical protein
LPIAIELTRFAPLSIRLLVLFGALTLILGCVQRDPADAIAAANDSNIRRVGNLYQAFRLRKGNQGPKDEAELKTFLKEMAPIRLERMQVDPNNLDALFISDRDGQPFVIRFGVSGGIGSTDAVVFESQGSGGKRQVGFTDGSVEEVDNSRYDQLLKGS